MTGPAQPWHVVIVDDSPEDRAEVRRLLLRGSDRRYRFTEAESGEAGIQAVRVGAGAPRCVVLDYTLPDMEALEVLDALKGEDGLPVCPVVVLTGMAEPSIGQRVLRAGAHDYTGKEWLTPPGLTRTLENAIERWTMARELDAQRVALEASEARHRMLFEASRESEARLRLALTASHTGIWTWDWKTDAVEWSAECYEIHGLVPGSFAGTGAAFFQLVHDDDRARVEATIRAAIVDDTLYECEFRIVRPGGEVLWVENLGRASYGTGSEPTRMLGSIRDISERKEALAELQRSEERLARAQKAAHVGTWDWDLLTGTIAWTDEAWRLLGHTPPPAPGTPVTYDLWLASIHVDDRERAAAAVQDALRTGVYRDEFRVQDRDGAMRWIESAGEALFGAGDRPVRLLGTMRAITERHEAERALRAALNQAEELARAREQIVSLVSHDLRNPLHVLTLATSLLQEQLAADDASFTPKRIQVFLDRIARQAGRMERLIDELLDVAQLQARKPLALDLRETDLTALVRSVAEEHQSSAAGHQIEVLAPVRPLLGRWDAQRLERVVNNLVSNAIKYSPAGGRVQVALGALAVGDRPWASLRVTDQGLGIPAADQARIFEWFSRGKNAQQSAIQGTGIGLAGVRQIVEQHGGSISVASEEGKGSSFTVMLPTEEPPVSRATHAPAGEESRAFDERASTTFQK